MGIMVVAGGNIHPTTTGKGTNESNNEEESWPDSVFSLLGLEIILEIDESKARAGS